MAGSLVQSRIPPGPRGAAAARTFAVLLKQPLATMVRLNQRYGEASALPMSPRRHFYVLTRPEHAEHLLAAHQDRYHKAMTYRLLVFLGSGLVTSEGETWRRHRRLIQPVFARRHVTSFAPLMAGEARRAVQQWDELPDGAVVDAAAEMNRLTLGIVGRALLGTDLTEDARQVGQALAVLQRAAVNPALFPLMWSPRLAQAAIYRAPRYGRAAATLEDVIRRVIAEHRATPQTQSNAEPRDLLDLLLAARDEDGTALDNEEIRDEVATFVLAGHETTANALSWSLALLSAHPTARARLEDEVDAVLTDRDPQADDLDKLPWTQAVISEAMRLYPPAWTIEREAVVDDEIDGIPVRAGSTVAIPPYLVHRNPEFWPNPEGFDPERFLPDKAAGRHRYAYIPFGGGRRGCVGAGFAMQEATLVLATLTQRYRLDLQPGSQPEMEPNVTLRLRGGLPMVLRRRH